MNAKRTLPPEALLRGNAVGAWTVYISLRGSPQGQRKPFSGPTFAVDVPSMCNNVQDLATATQRLACDPHFRSWCRLARTCPSGRLACLAAGRLQPGLPLRQMPVAQRKMARQLQATRRFQMVGFTWPRSHQGLKASCLAICRPKSVVHRAQLAAACARNLRGSVQQRLQLPYQHLESCQMDKKEQSRRTLSLFALCKLLPLQSAAVVLNWQALNLSFETHPRTDRLNPTEWNQGKSGMMQSKPAEVRLSCRRRPLHRQVDCYLLIFGAARRRQSHSICDHCRASRRAARRRRLC